MKVRNLKRYIRIWWSMAKAVAQQQLLTTWGGVAFFAGKILRFVLFFVFIASILGGETTLAGYSEAEVITFFLIFNIIDTTSQLLFRGVYVFRQRVVKGTFDLDLLKPLPSFFRPLFGATDILDAILLPFLIAFSLYYSISHGVLTSVSDFLLFLVMFCNAIFLAFAFHLMVVGVGVITTEIDHLIRVYRDITNIARFPTDIYAYSLQVVLTFVIPVVVLITVPVKSLMGIVTSEFLILSFVISITFVVLSIFFWRFAISKYTSASS